MEHTYAILEAGYGIMNEHQVAIGESTCAARFWGTPVTAGGKAQIEVREMSKIALERCDNARCAIQMMGDLAVKLGLSLLLCSVLVVLVVQLYYLHHINNNLFCYCLHVPIPMLWYTTFSRIGFYAADWSGGDASKGEGGEALTVIDKVRCCYC